MENKKISIRAIKTDVGYYIEATGWTNHTGTVLKDFFFDGKNPEKTFHQNWVKIPAIPFKIESSTIGIHLQGILDINMGYNLALSLKLGAYSGSLIQATITDINAQSKRTVTFTEPDNISRIDLHAGLRYKFGNH
jgi:hypothetical protein